MNCEEARQRWHTRRDEGVEDRMLDAHLADCADCRSYDGEMRSVMDGLFELASEPTASSELVKRAVSPSSRQRAVARIAAMIAISAGLVWWAAYGLRGPGESSHQETQVVDAGGMVPHKPGPDAIGDRVGLTLRGKTSGEYLAMARPTAIANVHVYWLYPTHREPLGE